LPLLGSAPFLLVNGDVWTDIDFGALRHDPPAGALAHLVLVRNPPQHARGDFLLEQGLVAEGEGDRHTYSGVGIYSAEFFAGCEPGKFPLLPLLRRAIARRALSGELHGGALVRHRHRRTAGRARRRVVARRPGFIGSFE
jgi:MurNAc alpha-1-phosphate uridylyltransferase